MATMKFESNMFVFEEPTTYVLHKEQIYSNNQVPDS